MANGQAAPRTVLGIDASDARWLRRFVVRALRASTLVPMASALAVAGCESGDRDAQSPTPWMIAHDRAGSDSPQQVCIGAAPSDLVAGMRLGREVDYLADVQGEVMSERGEPCATASDAAGCTAALSAATVPGRHLLTTEGDDVRVWLPNAAREVLGTIDAPEEVVWLALALDYDVSCSSSLSHESDGFQLSGITRMDTGCLGSPPAEVILSVGEDGSLQELEVVTHREMGCAVQGRRPPGLHDLPTSRARTALGAHFARAAQLEAASVPAFAQIAAELARLGAPAGLIAQATRAQRDERRHTRLTTRLARRFGAEPRAPRIAATKLRPLFELALDNAVEGCVFETYAALEAAHQAKVASDREVRVTMTSIASDEIRHAAFSHALHALLAPRLRDDERAALALARKDAVARLRSTLSNSEDSPALCVLAGVPTRLTALGLHAALSRTLWS